ncbi:bifunctional diguanylate cyclase/phosphodiesterase [Pseudorhodoferax sp.]|uniref:bifunctional diguanylate cyclase/phosphodiesterase n=1 Tax=Pseudorhodoferax sp. TaxID=1993553 RepID=UPI002DD6A320|nr:diguanylate cyclase [Pseudorhodoferax sp.]
MPPANPQLLVDRLARKRRKLFWLVVAANAAVALLLCVLVYSVLAASKRSYEEQATQAAHGIASVAQLSIGSELNLANAVIRATADELERLDPGATADGLINTILQSRLKLMNGVEALRLTDAVARVRWGNGLPDGPPMDVSDRDYFKQAKEMQQPATFVAGPVLSRVSGNWVVGFVRPIRVRGVFSGVLYVSLAADHFQRLLARYDLEDGDVIVLRRDDLRLLARHAAGSSVPAEVGDASVSSTLQQAIEADPRSGSFVSKAMFDGEVRTTAYRAVEGWPFAVYAGISHSRFFKAWERQAWQVSSLAALSWALVALATVLMYRASAREMQAMQALAAQNKRTQALLRVAGDGIHIVDREGRLVDMSDSFAEMLGSTRAELLGKHIASWDANQSEERIAEWLRTVQDKDQRWVDVQHRRMDGTVIDVELHWRVSDIGGETLIFCSGRDVTQMKRLLREQTAMLESDLVGMCKVEGRRFTWRNAAFERLFGFDPGELAGQTTRVLHMDDASFDRVGTELYEIVRGGAQYRTQLRMRKKSGEAIWVDIGAVRLSDAQVLLMGIDITAARAAHEHLAHVAFHDALTQLPNRLLLTDRLGQALATARRAGTRAAVCYLDLDGFKAVNDVHGHDAGDELLREVSRRLLANLRPSDTAARMGGDEFVLILTAVVGEEWRTVLERVSQAVAQPIHLASGAPVGVRATVGVALSGPRDTAAELLDRADRTMLKGKKSEKGCIFLT